MKSNDDANTTTTSVRVVKALQKGTARNCSEKKIFFFYFYLYPKKRLV